MNLDEAIEFARRAHGPQTDKAGQPYMEHVLRVVDAVEAPEEKMAAALHDVLEDTTTTAEDLAAAGCPAAVLDAVQVLTKRDGEEHEAAVRRAMENPIARAVKTADVTDNSDETRLALLAASEAARLRTKYGPARRLLRIDTT